MDALGGVVAVVAVGVALWLLLVALVWLHRPSREFVGPALRLVPDLVRLVRSLAADNQTPRRVRLALGGLLVYLLSPIDLIPEFLPGIGSLDDVIVAGLVLRWCARRVGTTDLRAHWAGTDESFALLCRLAGISPIDRR